MSNYCWYDAKTDKPTKSDCYLCVGYAAQRKQGCCRRIKVVYWDAELSEWYDSGIYLTHWGYLPEFPKEV